MPSKYKRKPGSRAYQTNYSKDVLAAAVAECKKGRNMNEVSKEFGIPYGTLWNHASTKKKITQITRWEHLGESRSSLLKKKASLLPDYAFNCMEVPYRCVPTKSPRAIIFEQEGCSLSI